MHTPIHGKASGGGNIFVCSFLIFCRETNTQKKGSSAPASRTPIRCREGPILSCTLNLRHFLLEPEIFWLWTMWTGANSSFATFSSGFLSQRFSDCEQCGQVQILPSTWTGHREDPSILILGSMIHQHSFIWFLAAQRPTSDHPHRNHAHPHKEYFHLHQISASGIRIKYPHQVCGMR